MENTGFFTNNESAIDLIKKRGSRVCDTARDGYHLVIIYGDLKEEQRRELFKKTVPGGYVILCNDQAKFTDPYAVELRTQLRGESFHHLSVNAGVTFFSKAVKRRWLSAWLSSESPAGKFVVVGQKQKFQSPGVDLNCDHGTDLSRLLAGRTLEQVQDEELAVI